MVPATQLALDQRGTPLVDVTFVVLDLETTGGSTATDAITEIGAVKVQGGERLGVLSTLVDPERPIPPTITSLTGIRDADVAGLPPIGGVLPMLLEFLRGSVIVAHNARFDVGFLNAALERRGYPRLDSPSLCTVALARRLVRDEVRDLKLQTLAQHLRARTSPCHRALPDAEATVDVLHALIERAGSLGATTLPDLLDLARVTSLREFRRVGLVADAPPAAGVYRFEDAQGRALYVGKATDLRSRLRQYFGRDPRRRMGEMVRRTARVSWSLTPTALEAEVEELRAIGRERPSYNRRSKHPERMVSVVLTREPFPRLAVSSKDEPVGAVLGPLTRRSAEQAAEGLATHFGLRPCRLRLRRRQDHPACALKDLGRCAAPCDGTQSAAEYAEGVTSLRATIAGDPTRVLEALGAEVAAAAGRERYERAGEALDRLEALAVALQRERRLTALAAAGVVVAASRGRGGREEVVVVDGGLLVGTRAVDRDGGGATGTERPPDELPLCDGAGRERRGTPAEALAAVRRRDVLEERLAVLRWLERPEVRVVEVQGTWAEPVVGGAALAAVEARRRRRGRMPR